MRMIDADFACKGCIRYKTSLPCEECVVNDAPTVDAVPVIRCKDCKHWKFAQHINDNLCHRFDGDPWIPTEPNDFCSYGERKEGAE